MFPSAPQGRTGYTGRADCQVPQQSKVSKEAELHAASPPDLWLGDQEGSRVGLRAADKWSFLGPRRRMAREREVPAPDHCGGAGCILKEW